MALQTMVKHYYIGCSGYYYNFWKNNFYPQDVKQKDWLKYYSSVFNAVELNGTFYRKPTIGALKKQADVTPPDFKFSVKVSRFITHNHKLNESKKLISDFQNLILDGLGNKLSCFLFQMPPSFHYNEENLQRILNQVPHKPQNVFEFRHASWWNAEVEKAFKKAKLTFCNVDFPGLKSFFINTSPVFYLRLHGSPQLFVSPYTVASLKNFYKNFPESCKSYHVYFNNTDGSAAFKNAQQLMEIVEKNKLA